MLHGFLIELEIQCIGFVFTLLYFLGNSKILFVLLFPRISKLDSISTQYTCWGIQYNIK